MLQVDKFPGPGEIAHLESEHKAAAAGARRVRLVVANFGGECYVVADRSGQLEIRSRTGVTRALSHLEVSQVAAQGCTLTHSKQEADALLVHDSRVGFEKGARRQRYAVQDGVILEPARHECADTAAAENVIQEECRLRHASTALIAANIDPLKAAEGAGLHVAPAVHETDIELPFLAARVIHELTL